MLKWEQQWYQSTLSWVSIFLLPFSWVFRGLVLLRRFLYRIHLKKTVHFSVPVIVVGNITVGGTGKTPFVIMLTQLLKEHGFKPAIVTRGVGGQQKMKPRWVEKNSSPAEVGDEALLLVQRTDCPVVIAINRVAAVKRVLKKTDANVIISDDGLQHYRLGRDVEIAIVDGLRGLGNKQFLPAGPLREGPKRLREVDFVIRHGGTPEEGEYAMSLHGLSLISVIDEKKKHPFEHFKKQKVHGVAAIGNPARFFADLRAYGLDVIEHAFPDHYLYQKLDFKFGDELPIIMTEKDAVKCREFADKRFWYVPVEIKIDPGFEQELVGVLRLVHD